jgi:hypothetical protein
MNLASFLATLHGVNDSVRIPIGKNEGLHLDGESLLALQVDSNFFNEHEDVTIPVRASQDSVEIIELQYGHQYSSSNVNYEKDGGKITAVYLTPEQLRRCASVQTRDLEHVGAA